MSSAPSDQLTVEAFRARNLMIQRVKASLAGSGLRLREREHELVISDPRSSDKSMVHLKYADGSVSVERTSWDFLGYLQGYKDEGDRADELVDTSQIINALNDSDANTHP